MWKIKFYKTGSGRKPVNEFLLSLPKKSRAKILRTMELLKEYGVYLREPYAKKLVGYEKLWELRVRVGKKNYRLFYFLKTQRTFVFVHCLIKKTKRIPKRDLNLAEKRMLEEIGR